MRRTIAQFVLDWAASDPSQERSSVAEIAPPFTNMTRDDWAESVRLWLTHGQDLLQSVPPRACPACGSDGSRELFRSYDGYPFNECAVCGCWFTPKRIDSSLFDTFFERCPEAHVLAKRVTARRAQETLKQADLTRIGEYLDELVMLATREDRRVLRYLDMGCGLGHSLIAAAERGLQAHGVEVDTYSLSLVRERGLAVSHASEELPHGPYHLISFWETLEHVHDPLAAIMRCVGMLDDMGLIAITVPNLASPTARLLRGDCSYIHGGTSAPGHINLFALPSLSRLLERAGLAVLDTDTEYANNPLELFGYLLGRTRAVPDMLQAGSDRLDLPRALERTLNSVWPAVMLIERIALTGPILKVIACRTVDAPHYAERVAALRERRHGEILAHASALAEGTDFPALVASLQKEVNIRDEMLQRLQTQANELQLQLHAVQQEVNVRDGMLHRLQGRLKQLLHGRF